MHNQGSPLYDKVLIRRAVADERSKGGIIIPDNAKEKPVKGEVLAVGAGRILDDGTMKPLVLKPGDVVLVGKYAGTEVEIDGEKLVIMNEADVLYRFNRP